MRVEQRMQVASEQETAVRMVLRLFGEAVKMRSFKDLWWL
jgi:hypothetical protein